MAKRFGGFTPEQLGKIVPEMQGMQADEQAKFLAATPGAAARVGAMTEVAQQRIDGAVKGFATGGVVTPPVVPDYAAEAKAAQENIYKSEDLVGGYTRELEALPAGDPKRADLQKLISEESKTLNNYLSDMTTAQARLQDVQQQEGAEQFAAFKSDPKGQVEAANVAKIATDPNQLMDTSVGQLTGTTPTAATTTAATPTSTAAPTVDAAPVVTTDVVTKDIQDTVGKLVAATGKPSADALADAATMSPQQLAQLGLNAEQIQQAQTVQAPSARTVQTGELISGSSVDMTRVDQAVNFAAATGAPSTDATVQGQLTGLMKQFEGAEPPAWAAGAMRAATAQLAARGLGASSMAGQAIVQAAMESSLPIAMQDAQTASSFEMQNLSNRQQTALFGAQQRANFLNLEFSQDFQTRVANASRISDIANMNFNAEQQIALENARMAQTVDLTNLGAANAKIMADAAAMSQVDIANLNNRQQAQVQQAQAFLQMDMASLNNEQQTNVFKTQQVANAMFTDQAAINAAAQFNASSQMQVDQFYENLAATVSMFNVEQKSTVDRFNAGEANAQAQFNSSIVNQREQFNASNSLLIEQANTVWAQSVATLDTAAQNQANRDEAMAMNEMSATAFSAMLQESRDLMSFAWQTGNNDADRATQLAIANIQSADAKAAASASKSSSFWSSVGNFAAAWAES